MTDSEIYYPWSKLRRKFRKYIRWHVGLDEMSEKLKPRKSKHRGKEIIVKHGKA